MQCYIRVKRMSNRLEVSGWKKCFKMIQMYHNDTELKTEKEQKLRKKG